MNRTWHGDVQASIDKWAEGASQKLFLDASQLRSRLIWYLNGCHFGGQRHMRDPQMHKRSSLLVGDSLLHSLLFWWCWYDVANDFECVSTSSHFSPSDHQYRTSYLPERRLSKKLPDCWNQGGPCGLKNGALAAGRYHWKNTKSFSNSAQLMYK